MTLAQHSQAFRKPDWVYFHVPYSQPYELCIIMYHKEDIWKAQTQQYKRKVHIDFLCEVYRPTHG